MIGIDWFEKNYHANRDKITKFWKERPKGYKLCPNCQNIFNTEGWPADGSWTCNQVCNMEHNIRHSNEIVVDSNPRLYLLDLDKYANFEQEFTRNPTKGEKGCPDCNQSVCSCGYCYVQHCDNEQLCLYWERRLYNNSIVITVEKELQGLYCEFPKFNYKTLENDGRSHLDIYITCKKCEICIKRRGLKIMKSIFAKFEVTDVPDYDLFKMVIDLKGLSATQMTNKIRYRYKKMGFVFPDWLLHTTDEKEGTVTYVTNGPMFVFDDNVISKITKDEALQIVKPGNKYRFMGKFYGPLPLKTSGLTKKEMEELNLIKPYKSDKCGCGILWKDHPTKGATAYDMFNTIEAADHYKRGHKLFVEKYWRQMLRVKNNGVEK